MTPPRKHVKTLQGRVAKPAKANGKPPATKDPKTPQKEVQDREFKVKILPPNSTGGSKKRKRDDYMTQRAVDLSMIDDRLNVSCSIGMEGVKNAWDTMKKYTTFKLGEDPSSIKVEDLVYVHNNSAMKKRKIKNEDDTNDWVAKVLECRAGDSQHVFLLITWFMRPDDLPGKRQWYHSDNEIIATNQIDIIDAMTVNDKADDVEHLDEWDDNSLGDGTEGLFWRQNYNLLDKSLSTLRKYCICGDYANPSIPLIHCSNPTCNIWMHQNCILDDILIGAQDEKHSGIPNTPRTQQIQDMKDNGTAKKSWWRPSIIFGASNGHDDEESETKAATAELAGEDIWALPVTPKKKKPSKAEELRDKRSAEFVNLDAENEPLMAEVTELIWVGGKKTTHKWRQPVQCLQCRQEIQ